MKEQATIQKIEGFIPCRDGHWDNDGGDYGGHTYFECCSGCDDIAEYGECSTSCPGYIPIDIKICKKHKREYLKTEGCPDCDAEYWDKIGRKYDRQMKIEQWFQLHLRFTLKYGWFGRFNEWVLDYRPHLGIIDKYDMQGKRLFRGAYITLFRHSLILRTYGKGEADVEQYKKWEDERIEMVRKRKK